MGEIKTTCLLYKSCLINGIIIIFFIIMIMMMIIIIIIIIIIIYKQTIKMLNFEIHLLSTTRRTCPKYGEIQTGMYFFCIHRRPGTMDIECD